MAEAWSLSRQILQSLVWIPTRAAVDGQPHLFWRRHAHLQHVAGAPRAQHAQGVQTAMILHFGITTFEVTAHQSTFN